MIRLIGVLSIALVFSSLSDDAHSVATLPGDAVLLAGEGTLVTPLSNRALGRSSDVQLPAGITELQLATSLPSRARSQASALWDPAIDASANDGGVAATGLDAGTTVLGLLIGGLGLLLLRAWRAKQ